jgi:CheY-like chemotaxis protein
MTDNWHVLLVEDEPRDQELMVWGLTSHGLGPSRIRCANSAEEAIKALEDPEPPGLVLLDLRLPGQGGLAVLRHIRSHDRTRRVPVIVLSAALESSTIAEAYDLGANSCVKKPHSLDEFEQLMNHVATYWTRALLPGQEPRKP